MNIDGSNKVLFVANLPINAQENDLRSIFERYGQINSAFIVKKGGKSRGIAFVEFEKSEEAETALNSTDGFKIWENLLKVQWAKPLSQEEQDRKSRNILRRQSEGAIPSTSYREDENKRDLLSIDPIVDYRSKDFSKVWRVNERLLENKDDELNKNIEINIETVISTNEELLNKLFKNQRDLNIKNNFNYLNINKRIVSKPQMLIE